ncbi:MAG: hypothetical protein K8T91_13250, partial [Planctomycetes bacterium]|nr:hypothetical protein [Planctomycetota bacterium]
MTAQHPTDIELRQEIIDLADAALLGELAPQQADRLYELISTGPRARQFYLEFIADSVRLQLARGQIQREAEGQAVAAPLARRASEGVSPVFSISRLALAAAVVLAIGLLAYTIWPGPATPPVVQQIPAAKIANLMDAKWAGASSQAGDTLIAGQQLLLQNGSVEITFNNQARVIVSGPVELTIVDAGACRLTTGKLT